MNATVVYKESINRFSEVQSLEILEVDSSEENAYKYSKLYGLQLNPYDKGTTLFKVFNVNVR